tara:strand:- start:528 stop:749 length:222 start_codon:yes stop_codon:yes gene_type:complete
MTYKVTYAIDSLDTQPVVKLFDEEYEALEWMNDEIQRRIEYVIEHSQFSISEKEYQEIEENEHTLVRIEKYGN